MGFCLSLSPSLFFTALKCNKNPYYCEMVLSCDCFVVSSHQCWKCNYARLDINFGLGSTNQRTKWTSQMKEKNRIHLRVKKHTHTHIPRVIERKSQARKGTTAKICKLGSAAPFADWTEPNMSLSSFPCNFRAHNLHNISSF